MIYSLEQTQTLQRVFDRAVTFPPHRLVGHCANATFWAAEVRHCLDLLNGHQKRFHAMKQATQEYLRRHPTGTPEVPEDLWHNPEFDRRAWEIDPRTTRGVTESQIAEARCALEQAAARFFRRCFEAEILTEEQLSVINEIVGFKLVDMAK